MRNHQFAIQTTDLATQVAELTVKVPANELGTTCPQSPLGQLLLNSHPLPRVRQPDSNG